MGLDVGLQGKHGAVHIMIHCIENTLTFDRYTAERIFELCHTTFFWNSPADFCFWLGDGNCQFRFKEGHDYLHIPGVRSILQGSLSTKGKVRFAALEGWRAGYRWSYIFDGEGNCRRTRGKI